MKARNIIYIVLFKEKKRYIVSCAKSLKYKEIEEKFLVADFLNS